MMTTNTTFVLSYEFTHEDGHKTTVNNRVIYGVYNTRFALEKYGIAVSDSTISRATKPRLYPIAETEQSIRAFRRMMCLNDQNEVAHHPADPVVLHLKLQREVKS